MAYTIYNTIRFLRIKNDVSDWYTKHVVCLNVT